MVLVLAHRSDDLEADLRRVRDLGLQPRTPDELLTCLRTLDEGRTGRVSS